MGILDGSILTLLTVGFFCSEKQGQRAEWILQITWFTTCIHSLQVG